MKRLEPDEGKLSSPVLRGGNGGNIVSLPDYVVEFPGGIFAFLSDEELADSHYYQVLDGASDAVAVPETGEGEAP